MSLLLFLGLQLFRLLLEMLKFASHIENDIISWQLSWQILVIFVNIGCYVKYIFYFLDPLLSFSFFLGELSIKIWLFTSSFRFVPFYFLSLFAWVATILTILFAKDSFVCILLRSRLDYLYVLSWAISLLSFVAVLCLGATTIDLMSPISFSVVHSASRPGLILLDMALNLLDSCQGSPFIYLVLINTFFWELWVDHIAIDFI